MKNYISIILTAAMTLTLAACTAAPDPAPLATPTPEPTAAPAAPTPAPAAADFYTLKSYDGSFDDGTAYYEFTQRLGYALLLKNPATYICVVWKKVTTRFVLMSFLNRLKEKSES